MAKVIKLRWTPLAVDALIDLEDYGQPEVARQDRALPARNWRRAPSPGPSWPRPLGPDYFLLRTSRYCTAGSRSWRAVSALSFHSGVSPGGPKVASAMRSVSQAAL